MHSSGFPLFLSILLVAGCSTAQQEARLAHMLDPAPAVDDFVVCHGSGCDVRTPTGLAPTEWDEIAALFEPSAGNAADERDRIALAIAEFETFVGPKTNTSADVGGNRTDSDQSRQLDCIDESVNTTSYLRLLADAGLLQWHEVSLPAHRKMGIIDFHNTAVVVERGTSIRWAVDSWFGDNGQPPSVLPLSAWLAGWSPGKPVPAATSTASASSQP